MKKTSPRVTVAATLIQSDKVEIAHAETATIGQVLVHIGETVQQGDPLIHLDDTAYRMALATAKATQQEIKARSEKHQFTLQNRDGLLAEGKLTELEYAGIDKDIALDEAERNRIDAEIAAIEQALTELTLASPIDGLITQKHVAPGQAVTAGSSMLQIINVNPIVVSFPLTADEAGGIALGDLVHVRIEEVPGEQFEAAVQYIGPELHLPDQSFTVWAAIPNPMGLLKIGMHAFAEFHTSKVHDVYALPTSAIVMQQNIPHVFVIKDGIARFKRVAVKSINKSEAQLTSGVQGNDWIVVRGHEGLKDGAIVDMRR